MLFIGWEIINSYDRKTAYDSSFKLFAFYDTMLIVQNVNGMINFLYVWKKEDL